MYVSYLLHLANLWMPSDLDIDLDLEDRYDLKIGQIHHYELYMHYNIKPFTSKAMGTNQPKPETVAHWGGVRFTMEAMTSFAY